MSKNIKQLMIVSKTRNFWKKFSKIQKCRVKYKSVLSRPATLPPRVTNKLRNQWRDEGNITACVIISTQDTARSNKK